MEQRGIEPLTSALRTRRSAKLSYCPTRNSILPFQVSGFKFQVGTTTDHRSRGGDGACPSATSLSSRKKNAGKMPANRTQGCVRSGDACAPAMRALQRCVRSGDACAPAMRALQLRLISALRRSGRSGDACAQPRVLQRCVGRGDACAPISHSDPDPVRDDLKPAPPTIDIRSHKLLVALGEIHDSFDDADHVHKR